MGLSKVSSPDGFPSPEEKKVSSDHEDTPGSVVENSTKATKRPAWLRPFMPPPVPEKRLKHGDHGSWFLGHAFFSWVSYLVWTAMFRQLDMNDIEHLDTANEANVRVDRLLELLHHYANRKSRYPLYRAIFACYRYDIFAALACIIIHVYSGLYLYLLFRTFGEYLEGNYYTRDEAVRGGLSFGHGLAIIIGLALAYFAIMVLKVHSIYLMEKVGGQVRTSLGCAMFEKSFVISPSARRKDRSKLAKQSGKSNGELWTTGSIMSSMATDTQRIEDLLAWVPESIAFISGIPGVIALGWILLNWPGLVASCLLALLTPPVIQIMRSLAKQRASVNVLTDRRVDLVNDLIQGVRFLKIFAWEDIFLARLAPVRKEEIRKSMRMQLTSVSTWISTFAQQRGSVLLAVGLYTLYGSVQTPSIIIPYALALWFMGYHSIELARAAPVFANALSSVHNIEDFLFAEEQIPGSTFEVQPFSANAVEMNDACFEWIVQNPTNERGEITEDMNTKGAFQLQPLTLSIKVGELVAIVGPVGCGKSSVAAALTGEMSHQKGTVRLRDSIISYHSQTPWIQNSTVRDNIVFGMPWDEKKYRRIVSACALTRDINEEFPAGDHTELGERGITISGGQKARIQLARTLYRGLNTVILDDPLSAVDAHTSTHIFDNVIVDVELQGCTRILITHQLHILSRCDRVVWMDDGRIRAVDTFETLMDNEPDFAHFVGDTMQHAEEEEEDLGDDSFENLTSIKDEADASALKITETISHAKKQQQQEREKRDQLIEEEERAVKAIPFSLYWDYFKYSPRWVLPFLIFFLIASQVANMMFILQLAYWTSDRWHLGNLSYAMICLGVGSAHISTWATYYVGLIDYMIYASQGLSMKALESVLHSPMSFFDTTPVGRIINRFSLDLNFMDTTLAAFSWQCSLCSTAVLSILVLVIYYLPIAAALFVPWIAIAWFILYLYRSTPLEIKRLEVLRTSIYVAKISEGIHGRQAITSCGREKNFGDALRAVVDELNSIHFMSFAARAWMTIRQDALSCFLQTLIGILVLRKRYVITPGVNLFLFAVGTEICIYIQDIIETGSGVQRGMNGVERVTEYAHLPAEGMRRLSNFEKIHKDWPQSGELVIANASMRYRPRLPLALHNLNLTIPSGEKIGIVGRTGAGKSSILAILLRTVELAEGTITISGVNTRSIGLHDLRRRISVIPQDPTLFQGTLRFNLDPEGTVPDETLLAALKDVALISETDGSRQRLTLDSPVATEGKNFSSGDRQLIALARALVRDNKVIIIDEATSSVDPRTDHQIQRTIREHRGMRDKTIIAIAHRIKTIVEYDKVCVMEKGAVVEFGRPGELFRMGGRFRALCEKSHIKEEGLFE